MIESKRTPFYFKTGYGIVRIFACLMVIAHHIIAAIYYDETSLPYQKVLLILDNLFMVNNGLFFMMSGKFALEKITDSIRAYYQKRVIKIVFPFLFVTAIQYCIQNGTILGITCIKDYISGLLRGDIYDWFVYAVIGFYLIAPFFAKMLAYTTQKEKKAFMLLLILCIAINTINNICGPIIFMNGNPFVENLCFFMIGYLIDNIEDFKKWKHTFMILGLISAVISCVEITYNSSFNPILYGPCLSRIFMCIGFYTFFGWSSDIKSVSVQKIVHWLSNLTFYIYLFHISVQNIVLPHIRNMNIFVKLLFGSALTFLVSLLFAFSMNCLIIFYKKIKDTIKILIMKSTVISHK